jgi:hypothetical protein
MQTMADQNETGLAVENKDKEVEVVEVAEADAARIEGQQAVVQTLLTAKAKLVANKEYKSLIKLETVIKKENRFLARLQETPRLRSELIDREGDSEWAVCQEISDKIKAIEAGHSTWPVAACTEDCTHKVKFEANVLHLPCCGLVKFDAACRPIQRGDTVVYDDNLAVVAQTDDTARPYRLVCRDGRTSDRYTWAKANDVVPSSTPLQHSHSKGYRLSLIVPACSTILLDPQHPDPVVINSYCDSAYCTHAAESCSSRHWACCGQPSMFESACKQVMARKVGDVVGKIAAEAKDGDAYGVVTSLHSDSYSYGVSWSDGTTTRTDDAQLRDPSDDELLAVAENKWTEHKGEFRLGTKSVLFVGPDAPGPVGRKLEYYCSLPDNGEGDGAACAHPKIDRNPHWSCCGQALFAQCVVKTEETEDPEEADKPTTDDGSLLDGLLAMLSAFDRQRAPVAATIVLPFALKART